MKSLLLTSLSIFLIFSADARAEELTVTFFDVGEGDAALVSLGEKRLLIDTGNLITGPKLATALQSEHKSVDQLLLTHPHLDHIGGVFSIMSSLRVGSIYDNGEELREVSRSNDVYRWYQELVRKNPHYRAIKSGDTLQLGRASVKVLWPSNASLTPDWNTNSAILLLEFGSFRALFMGDGNAKTERALLASHSLSPITLLKAGHHGASDAGTQAFLNATKPKVVIVSVNRNNVRGYPSEETLHRYEQIGASVFRTDRDSDIIVSVSPDGSYQVKTTNS